MFPILLRATLLFLPFRGYFSKNVFSVIRSSIATFTNKFKKIEVADNNVPRLDYDPLTGELLGLKVEGFRTNNFLYGGNEYIVLNPSTTAFIGTYTITNRYGLAPNGKAQSVRLVGGNSLNGLRISNCFDTSVNTVNTCLSLSIKVTSFGTSACPDISFNGVSVTPADVTLGEWTRIEGANSATPNWIDIKCTANCDFEIWGFQNEPNHPNASSFIETKPLFISRASTKRYVDANGCLQTASIDEEVKNHHVYINGRWVNSGQLLESQTTNSFPYSNSNYSFTGGATKKVANRFVLGKPMTHANASSLNDWAGINTSSININSGTISALSWYFHFGNSPQINFRLRNTSNLTETAFTIQASDLSVSFQSMGSGVFTVLKIQELPEGVYKIYGVHTANANGYYYVRSGTGRTNTSEYVGVGLFQLEKGIDYPTTHIPTMGAPVTRSADVYSTATATRAEDTLKIEGKAFTDFYNHNEGTFLIEASLEEFSGCEKFLTVQKGIDSIYSNDNFGLRYMPGNHVNVFGKTNNGADVLINSSSFSPRIGEFNTYLFTYEQEEIRFYANGSEICNIKLVHSLPSLIDNLLVMDGNMSGIIRRMLYYPVALDKPTSELLTKISRRQKFQNLRYTSYSQLGSNGIGFENLQYTSYSELGSNGIGFENPPYTSYSELGSNGIGFENLL